MLPQRTLVKLRQNACCLQSLSYSVQTIKMPRQHEWNRAVKSAEKIVGYPTSMLNLQSLMSDDVTNITDHVQKLMGTDHPVLKSFKRLIMYGGQNNIQVRGLVTLLLAKSLNGPKIAELKKNPDFDEKTEILTTQRKLAEIVEMISAAYSVHKSVLNLPQALPQDASDDVKDDLQQLEYGNKIAILGGDYLLGTCTKLS